MPIGHTEHWMGQKGRGGAKLDAVSRVGWSTESFLLSPPTVCKRNKHKYFSDITQK